MLVFTIFFAQSDPLKFLAQSDPLKFSTQSQLAVEIIWGLQITEWQQIHSVYRQVHLQENSIKSIGF